MTPQTNVLPDTVEEMLLDAGFGQDDSLRSALLSLGSLASLPAPVPSGELAALLAGDNEGPVRDELGRRRWLRAHRPTVVGLALIAGMGMGAGGVAASTAPPGQAGNLSIQHMLKDWAPAWSLPAPQALGTGLHSTALSGSSGAEVKASEPDAGDASDSQPATAGTVENPPGPRRGPDSAGVPAAPASGVKGSGPAAAGQGVAKETGNDAGAAATGKAGGQPEHAVGQDGQVGSDVPGKVGDAVPGVLAHVAGGTLQGTADTAGQALKAIPGNSWLQKFNQ
ncbi:hypothetical protein QF038_003561 [Pseudarthrobacter sp. W1I19]|uniref:hypothetical protein n=1 Tax=Pseudarthrobacter sp. W1I19 TaxID=3042288 RepID=UPI00278A64BD|nr:hypothetical protein [Pseudarthrobacter sp. W1I19]MDQ0925053.1 hypothetical protein [Pseudarthrobacter sp. W1I19]